MVFQRPVASPKKKSVRSTWVMGIIAALFLISAIQSGGGLGSWLVVMGLILLVTAVYSLVFRRVSWARFSSAKASKIGLVVGVGALVIGVIATPGEAEPAVAKAGATVSPSPTATKSATPTSTPTPTPTPTPTRTVVAGAACPVAGKVETVLEASNATPTSTPSATASPTPSAPATATGASSSATPTPSPTKATSVSGAVFTCTEDDDQKLVWMDKDTSDRMLADRKSVEEKKEADRVAAEEAESKRKADEAAAVEAQRVADEQVAAAETQRVADEQAAAEAQRLADEQARLQPVIPAPLPAAPAPAPAPLPEPAPAPVPAPSVVHPGSFCSTAGAVGVTNKGTPMVCATASDGRLRWRSA